jgi:hypothetical protein
LSGSEILEEIGTKNNIMILENLLSLVFTHYSSCFEVDISKPFGGCDEQ